MTAALAPVMATAPALAVAVLSRVIQVALEVLFAFGTVMLARRKREASASTGLTNA